MHQAELHLAITLAAELRRQVRSPELLPLDLVLNRADGTPEAALVDVEDLEWIDLVVNEPAHPLELLLELWLGRKVPAHSSSIPASIMRVMVSVRPSYMGSGRFPRRWSMRL